MEPFLRYNKTFLMDDGCEPSLTVGGKYPLDCSFMDGDSLIVSVINDDSNVHTFDTTEEWFSEHFDVVGDVDYVMEQI